MNVAAVPKADIHLHLEGAIRPTTVIELAKENGLQLPYADAPGLESALEYDNFLGFLDLFAWVNRCLAKPDDFTRITRELVDGLASQNVCYAEIRYSPMHAMRRGLSFDDIASGVTTGAEEGLKAHPNLRLSLICCLTRQLGLDLCGECVQGSIRWLGRGIAGIDIGGDEVAAPAEQFVDLYRLAAAAGLGLTAHAGEAAGAESVWTAVRQLGVRRIGHGIRAVEDTDLLAFLREEQVTLEVCPTSNVRTGVVPSYALHPLRRLHDAGVLLTINSDDPAMFRTNTEREYEIAEREFGFSEAELREMTRNAVKAGFCSSEVKSELLGASGH